MKDFYSPKSEINYQTTEPNESNHIDTSITVKKDCPKCDGQRALETNRVSVKNKNQSPNAFITRYKCVKCGHSWVAYEKE